MQPGVFFGIYSHQGHHYLLLALQDYMRSCCGYSHSNYKDAYLLMDLIFYRQQSIFQRVP